MRSVLSLRSARPRAVIISLTNSPPGSNVRHSRRNGALVMPAMGASTTGGHTASGPIRSGGPDVGPADGHGVCAHRSVMAMPRSARSVRSSGRDRPITVPWLPSIPVTKGAPYPSMVHAPATASGSPVAM